MGEATKGEGFSSSLVYALIMPDKAKVHVEQLYGSSRKKLVRVEIIFMLQFDACADSVYQARFSLSPRPLRRAWFRG